MYNLLIHSCSLLLVCMNISSHWIVHQWQTTHGLHLSLAWWNNELNEVQMCRWKMGVYTTQENSLLAQKLLTVYKCVGDGQISWSPSFYSNRKLMGPVSYRLSPDNHDCWEFKGTITCHALMTESHNSLLLKKQMTKLAFHKVGEIRKHKRSVQ